MGRSTMIGSQETIGRICPKLIGFAAMHIKFLSTRSVTDFDESVKCIFKKLRLLKSARRRPHSHLSPTKCCAAARN